MLRALILLAVATLVALTSCGTPGAPQPPSLQLPQPPDDLAAVRKGNKVTLTWTMPRETTDRATLRASKLGPTKICRGLANPLAFCTDAQNPPANAGIFVGQLTAAQTPIPQQERGTPKLSYTDTLSPEVQRGHETDFATYAIQIFNWHGHAAGLSNQVRVPLATTLSPPSDVRVEMTSTAVHLSWTRATGVSSFHDFVIDRVSRRADETQNWTVEGNGLNFVSGRNEYGLFDDRSFQWEHTYFYKVTPITRVMKDGKVIAEVEGDDSPEIKVYTKDIFPPAQPSGVQAVFSGTGQKPFIDVTWAPNTEDDLAGYNVFRREQGASPQKINAQVVKTPSFRDENVQAGRTYFYSVSAIDLRNNESPKSEETSETAPK